MKKFLLLSAKKSFLIKGLLIKLEDAGLSSDYASAGDADVDAKMRDSEMFIFYMDSDMQNNTAFIKHIDDVMKKDGKMAILIGKKEEKEFVMQFIQEEFVLSFYERPLDMDVFVRDLLLESALETNEGEKKVILVVDDDTEYRQLIRGWLRADYHVALANSGVQAITWLAKNTCDLILLDYAMPVTDGKKVLEMLKSEENTKDIPVMFLTGKNDKESIMEVLKLNPDDYLLKTIGRDALLEKMHEFFESREW